MYTITFLCLAASLSAWVLVNEQRNERSDIWRGILDCILHLHTQETLLFGRVAKPRDFLRKSMVSIEIYHVTATWRTRLRRARRPFSPSLFLYGGRSIDDVKLGRWRSPLIKLHAKKKKKWKVETLPGKTATDARTRSSERHDVVYEGLLTMGIWLHIYVNLKTHRWT